MSDRQTLKIEIGHRSVIFIIFLLLSLKFISAIQSILISVFIAYLISTAVYPLVNILHRFKIPTSLSALVILSSVIIGLLATLASILPVVITQTSALINKLPILLEQLGNYNIDSNFLTNQIGSFSANILRFAADTLSITIMTFTLFVISFYFIQERSNLDARLRYLFGDKSERAKKLILEIETQLGNWVRTIITLMFIVGILNYLGFRLISLEYALPLAVIAGILELIPNIGPIVATIPATIVGFAISPFHGVMVLSISFLVQQLENSVLVPGLMKNSTGLHPVITIIALLIGYKTGGALLAVLSLPFVLVGKIVLSHLYENKFTFYS